METKYLKTHLHSCCLIPRNAFKNPGLRARSHLLFIVIFLNLEGVGREKERKKKKMRTIYKMSENQFWWRILALITISFRKSANWRIMSCKFNDEQSSWQTVYHVPILETKASNPKYLVWDVLWLLWLKTNNFLLLSLMTFSNICVRIKLLKNVLCPSGKKARMVHPDKITAKR